MEQEKMQELLKKRLKEKGLKVTRQRLLVLSVLEQNNGSHMTAEDIYELVSEDYPEIGLATFDDGCVRYELGHLFEGEAKHNHHHLICRRCSKVIPFDADLLDDLEHHIEKATGFHVLDHELKFYGICRECMRKRK